MNPKVDALAGKPAPESMLVDVPKLLDAYKALRPDPSETTQRVSFGTSGHRGSSFDRSFNEWHVLAITQAICDYRRQKNITGPLYIGIDTHALSQPALESAVEVLVANEVAVAISAGGEFTPTPAVSHAILTYNRNRHDGLADGIVVTPSHNPPADGGFKYNPPNGGPAETDVTSWIQQRANALLESRLDGVKRISFPQARRSSLVQEYDFLGRYVDDLKNIIDFEVIRSAGVRMAVDPLGGAGVHYWQPIAQRYGIDLNVVSDTVDPTFRFMTVDWDGKIRMDPSSQYAMQRLIGLKDRYDVAFACDTDHDRHGVVSRSAGLMPSNHYLSVMVDYLFRHRPQWTDKASVGKTVVSSSLIDRVTKRLGRRLYEVPVGFKWFADGLFNGVLGFGCEESAGASMLRHDGKVWTTDKDGIVPSLLAAEMTARLGKDPGELYADLTEALGKPYSSRVDAAANAQQKARLAKLSPGQLQSKELAGEKITEVLDRAPGNNAPIGGIKVMSESGWFAARPSGTEEIYKIYGESFRSEEHLKAILSEAQGIVDAALAGDMD
ncbi:phosphoglucomutase (alpha-D-glucose-1,6-bisphosphate-dependent) [Dyella nitratireducens]|uniref:Phosphoglucomutase n=1 Tax=Dyella nitratireducens TaxID=1849580 RepID=A0ABQ1G6I9_9GAMM|nr:phosphoglucomutase (alpha-D-glucose-1,6-bisphosphate-dependent) [Dyella nitratireducens]GGA37751.1 phosphoglucomutase, alpha-D-glucose phosphate-specific [Dyella nitratireducens]GLQ40221.1 phosphoglucomutase, alpha-D-glucose phosphate-specific [Dyella nitratireducens]